MVVIDGDERDAPPPSHRVRCYGSATTTTTSAMIPPSSYVVRPPTMNGGGGGGGTDKDAQHHDSAATAQHGSAAAAERLPLLQLAGDRDKERWTACTAPVADAAAALPVPSRDNPPAKPGPDDDGDEEKTSWHYGEGSLLRDEMAGMIGLAVPVVLTYMLEMLPKIFTIILVGRVGYYDDGGGGGDEDGGGDGGDAGASLQKLRLDAASLAVMFTNVVAMAPAVGLMSAMDTLCSQAHGANQPWRMGTYFLTGAAVAFSVFLGGGILIWNASSLLIALGQPTEVSMLAGGFARAMIPGVPFLYLYELIRKVMQSRNDAVPMLVAAVACNAVNVGLGYYLVRWTGWGWMGAAVARSVGNVALVAAVLAGIASGFGGVRVGPREKDRGGGGGDDNVPNGIDDELNGGHFLEVVDPAKVAEKNRECNDDTAELLHQLWEGFVVRDALSARALIEFLSLGFPGMLQVMLEWTAFEVIALLCGILPGNEAIVGIGANAIVGNVSSLTFMFYLGVSVSGNVRIGNALGAGDVRRAEIASGLTMALAVATAAISVTFLLTFRKSVPWLFTADQDIVEKAQHVFLVIAMFQLPDALNSAVQGIFRGSGRQALGAKVNFMAYYLISIPLGYVLGVRLGLGVEGLWLGMTVGLCAIAIGCTMIVVRSDWNKLALKAAYRLNR